MIPSAAASRFPHAALRRAVAPLAVAVVVACAVAGCGGTSSAVEPGTVSSTAVSPSVQPSSPAVPRGQTESLRSYGFSNGPAGFVLPNRLSLVYGIDQPNVVTAFFAASEGPHLAEWLAAQLPSMGYRVDAASADSVVFSGGPWSGAFTSDSQVSALTLRRN